MSRIPQWVRLLFQRKMLLILILGFVSGLPLGLTGTTLQAWYAIEGVDIVTIGFLGLVGQPYVYKFMWAPLMDKWQMPFAGRRKGWILTTQFALIAFFIAIALTHPISHPYYLAFLALSVAFFSATQDIAIDAYRTELLTTQERGLGTSMAVSGYRIAMLVSGGLTLVMAHYIGFSITYLFMAVLMGIGVIVTLFAKEPPHYREPSPHFLSACVAPFKEFLSRKNAVFLLIFLMIYKLGDVFANGLTTVFLLKGVGFSLVDIGLTNKTVGLAATLIGVFLGGAMMVRLGLFRALVIFGIIQALTNLLFLVLTWVGPDKSMLVLTVAIENIGSGLGTAAFMVLIMSLCKAPYTATQFALFSAITAMGRVFVGPLAGLLVEKVGWSEFFIWTVIFAIPGLLLLIWLRGTIDSYEADQKQAALPEDAVSLQA